MKKTKISKLLVNLKTKAMMLRDNGQLPYQLVKFIYDLTADSDEKYVRFLTDLTRHYMRVKGYYKLFKDADKQASGDIKRVVSEKGFLQD